MVAAMVEMEVKAPTPPGPGPGGPYHWGGGWETGLIYIYIYVYKTISGGKKKENWPLWECIFSYFPFKFARFKLSYPIHLSNIFKLSPASSQA